jgi:hypothetical protein
MNNTRFTRYFMFFALLLSGAIVSCQKDDDVKTMNAANQVNVADSNAAVANLTEPNNYLAVKGTLKISIQDSTYSFDASRDSIAFVNVKSNGTQYFGITAINKSHNMSFGISSAGYAISNSTNEVAGSQFIFKRDNKPDIQFSLTQFASSQDFGKISLTSFKKDSVLAVGTFYTFLAKDAKPTSPFYRVKGTFSLKLK